MIIAENRVMLAAPVLGPNNTIILSIGYALNVGVTRIREIEMLDLCFATASADLTRINR